jgi:hypothetical protein
VSGFSEDGRWWWDGTAWVATAQLVLPQLPATQIELSGKVKGARDRKGKDPWVFLTTFVDPLFWLFGFQSQGRGGTRDYRAWTLEQLALATTYLLGPNEPMLAGEVSMYDLGLSWTRDLAVAVTAGHVLVFRIDHVDGQPRWIALVARASDVTMESHTGVFGFLWPALVISGRPGRWTIRGYSGLLNPQPVLDAWRQAAKHTVRAG